MAGIGRPQSPRRSVVAPTSPRRTAPRSRRPRRPRRAGDRELGIEDPHPLVADMWTMVQDFGRVRFYSEADWARLRLELWNANAILTSGQPISGNAWATVQHGLNERCCRRRKSAVPRSS